MKPDAPASGRKPAYRRGFVLLGMVAFKDVCRWKIAGGQLEAYPGRGVFCSRKPAENMIY
ncbi:hypothetical protein D3Z39_09070 [Anaerotruncus colihominis]|uniref:Uncharacterized protein n=1 Tax=Anaerotruncus colihominis TaxID=169435 RepID=A0A845RJT2_9FIRM|nr:hypothetical protein [Anaerotruncus colihominis]